MKNYVMYRYAQQFRAVLLVLSVFLVPFACNDETAQEVKQESVSANQNDPVVNYILSLGFASADVKEWNEYFIVEGDILFNKDTVRAFLNSPANGRVKQAKSFNTVDVSHQSIRIYVNTGQFTSIDINTAVTNAINAFNNVNSNIRLLRGTSSSYDIRIDDTNLGSGVCGAGGFPVNGTAYNQIYINEAYLTSIGFTVAQLTRTVTHEIGHCVGLRHTNWASVGEGAGSTGAVQIPGTPSSDGSSIMNSGECGRTISFSRPDIIALQWMYPGDRQYLAGNWDGSGGDNIAFREDNLVYMDYNYDGTNELLQSYGNGLTDGWYIAGDWDGDGRDNIAVRRGNIIWMDYNFDGTAEATISYGNGDTEDQYVFGDWDGDGDTNIGVRRAHNIYLDTNGDGIADLAYSFGNGNAEDDYLVGDWDGNGTETFAVRRGNQIIIDNGFDSIADLIITVGNGNSEHAYLVGDWDGDGDDNIAVQRGNLIYMDFDNGGAFERVQSYGNGI